jgi:hypothetical protein
LEVAERSLRLVAKEVLPVLKKMTAATVKASDPQHAAA